MGALVAAGRSAPRPVSYSEGLGTLAESTIPTVTVEVLLLPRKKHCRKHRAKFS